MNTPKQLAESNSFDNVANLLSNSPHVHVNFDWSHVYPYNVIKSLKTLNPLTYLVLK